MASNDDPLEHTWVVDAHSAHAIEDGHGEVEHSRGSDEDALRKHRAKDHHGHDWCREVDGVVRRVDDPGVNDAKHNTPAHVYRQASDQDLGGCDSGDSHVSKPQDLARHLTVML